MVEKMIGSTFNSSNVHEVVDNNNNYYINMVIDAIRMNQSHVGQFQIIDEEHNTDTTMLFFIIIIIIIYFLKDSDEPL